MHGKNIQPLYKINNKFKRKKILLVINNKLQKQLKSKLNQFLNMKLKDQSRISLSSSHNKYKK